MPQVRVPLWILPILALALLCGCPRRPQVRETPPPPPPPPAFQVPQGCEARISGTFVHEVRRDWEYAAEDDGTVLTLTVQRAPTEGAAGDAGPRIVLRRLPEGFVGQAKAKVFAGGTLCDVSFPTRLVACEELALTLETVGELAVDEETCQVAEVPEAQAPTQHRLIRLPPEETEPSEDAPQG